MDLQPPPPQHQYPPSPSQNTIPNPNLQQQQQQQQLYHYPNPNPNPNLQQQPQLYYYPNPQPEAGTEVAAAGTYAPHGGYSVGATTSAGATSGAGALPYYYYQGYGWDPSHYHGVDPNSHGQVPPAPSGGLNNSTVPSHAISSQWGAKSNGRRGSKKGFRTTKVAQPPVHCGVCKIECDTQEVLNVHKQGKKHKRNLQKLQESITPKSQRTHTTTHDAEKKETKILGGAGSSEVVAQRAYCEVCKIYCDTEAVLNIHVEGKKHKKNSQKLQHSVTPRPQKDQVTANDGEGEAEPNDVVQPPYCVTCNVFCNTQEVLNIHNMGKKHKKNISKLQNSITQTPQSAGNKDAPISEQAEASSGFKQRKRGKVTEEDLETKKRKILIGGAEPSKLTVCTACNVVVNSQLVYDTHIASSKHIAMVKKQLEEAAIVDGEKSVNSESSVHSNLASGRV